MFMYAVLDHQRRSTLQNKHQNSNMPISSDIFLLHPSQNHPLHGFRPGYCVMLGSHLNLSLLKPLEAFYFIGGHLNQQRMVMAVSASLFLGAGGGGGG